MAGNGGNVVVGGSTVKGGIDENNGLQLAQGATATAHQTTDALVTMAVKSLGTEL